MQISASRLIHSWNALALVDKASETFMTSLSHHLTGRFAVTTTFNRKLLLSTRRALQGTYMKVGTRCKKGFVLSSMGIYSNNYFTAALWKK